MDHVRELRCQQGSMARLLEQQIEEQLRNLSGSHKDGGACPAFSHKNSGVECELVELRPVRICG
jgi:hypothetical protein